MKAKTKMKYRINWESKETGKSGHGEPIFNTYEMADSIASNLNREYPYMTHHVEGIYVEEVIAGTNA